MSRWDTWQYDELVEALSDYHKDVFGYRLRMNGALTSMTAWSM